MSTSPYHKRLVVLAGTLFFLLSVGLAAPRPAQAAACNFTFNGDTALSASCEVLSDTQNGPQGCTTESSTGNTAALTVSNGMLLTVQAGQSGTTQLLVGSVTITGTNSRVAIESPAAEVRIANSAAQWVADADADGWSADISTTYTATAAGRRRICLMHGSTADCDDNAYSVANSCYSYGQAWYYGYGQSWYYGYGQGWYYGYGQAGYWIYGYGYSQCFPKDTRIRMADGTLRNIQDLKNGDPILSYDLESGETVPNAIESFIIHAVPGGYLVLNKSVQINPGYLTWVANKESWLRAEDVEIGDELLNPDGTRTTVSSIDKVEGNYMGFHITLTNKEHNNFFAGDVLVLQH